MFQRSHYASIGVRARCSFLRAYLSLRSVAYIHVSSAKRAKWTPGVCGASFVYKLYRVGTRTEPCGTPACISLGVDNAPSSETVIFLLVKNELISFIKFVEKCNLDNFYEPGCHIVSEAFSISKDTAAVVILLIK